MAETRRAETTAKRRAWVWMLIGVVVPLLAVSAGAGAVDWFPKTPVVGEVVEFVYNGGYGVTRHLEFRLLGNWETLSVIEIVSGPTDACNLNGQWDERTCIRVRFTQAGTFEVCTVTPAEPLKSCSYQDKNHRTIYVPCTPDYACFDTITVLPATLVSPSASVTPSTPFLLPPASSPSPSSATVALGAYTLRLVEAIKCASVEERPYTSLVVGAVGGGGLIHLPQVLVDSGADMSVLPAWVAQELGVDLSTCEEREFGGVGGGKIVGRLAQVRIGVTHLGGIETDVDGYILSSKGEPFLPTITVAFIEDDSTFILGRTDAFDVFDFEFTSDTVTIRVAK